MKLYILGALILCITFAFAVVRVLAQRANDREDAIEREELENSHR